MLQRCDQASAPDLGPANAVSCIAANGIGLVEGTRRPFTSDFAILTVQTELDWLTPSA
ncbi:hypothetical protein J3A65_000909 [Rhizobium sp. PvP014]|nr:hypothetical protein [Rhizobium sp. PvP014]MBP2531518.1 hypothetical protein [Rhizobium sp. PvP099]